MFCGLCDMTKFKSVCLYLVSLYMHVGVCVGVFDGYTQGDDT